MTTAAAPSAARHDALFGLPKPTATPEALEPDLPAEVRVTAELTDPDLRGPALEYFDANAWRWRRLGRLRDDGRRGDRRAADGVFSVLLWLRDDGSTAELGRLRPNGTPRVRARIPSPAVLRLSARHRGERATRVSAPVVVSAPRHPGHEVLEPAPAFPRLRVWGTTELTPEEYDALVLPPGWLRNQPREGTGAVGRFLHSPGAASDGEFTRREMFGIPWLHQATVVGLDGPLDPAGLLTAARVDKHHELLWPAGRAITLLTSPAGLRYILVSRDARRTAEVPTLPPGWTLEVVPLFRDLDLVLPRPTTVIRADNEDSFQGPLPAHLGL